VAEYVAQGGEYYTCDPKVQSEACLPMFDNISGCIGIIDAEAFSTGIFDEQVLAVLVAACIRIPQYLPRS
jgi:putative methionine-R-sulfoxide reductase with GAF domain